MSFEQKFDNLIDSAKDLYFQIAQLDPPSQNASPTLKKKFHKMVQTVSQASGQTYDIVIGMGQLIEDEHGGPIDPKTQYLNPQNFHNSDNETDGAGNTAHNQNTPDPGASQDQDPPNPGSPNPNQSSPPPDDPAHIQIANDILAEISPDRGEVVGLPLKDFLNMALQGGHNGKVQEQEYEAFRRSVLGYQPATFEEIKKMFRNHNSKPSSLPKTALRVLQLDDIEDDTERLTRRERYVFYGSNQDNVSVYVSTVLRNIEGIKAYKDWYSLPLAFKKQFRKDIARTLQPQAFQELDRMQGRITPKELQKLYNKLTNPTRKKYDKLVDRRKRLLKLFDACGPVVLLDPTFSKMTGRGQYPQQSSTFCNALDEIVYRIKENPISPDRHLAGRRFVLRAMLAIGGTHVEDYVRHFLNNHTSPEMALDFDDDYMEE
ncbi:hypothetical protein C8R42DRAFT_716853 [Lentinula raphanica]|nr:hypothetical protein C8R42DRAFT_729674 [Lentinula raphanica]KAJ3727389.1 hypothetical protein C8R42DRAFT_716853 [Lentinula raphanica]